MQIQIPQRGPSVKECQYCSASKKSHLAHHLNFRLKRVWRTGEDTEKHKPND